MTLSIIMPVLDEAGQIATVLDALAPMRQRGVEVVVADGRSRDGTPDRARQHADRVVNAPRGRAIQMNAGAAHAKGDVFLFLHADTRLPGDADRLILDSLAHSQKVWGRFDVRIEGGFALSIVALFMNIRSRLTGIATGVQAIFVRRTAFEAVGGFPQIALMEDVALSARLRHQSRPLCLRPRAVTSGRRWHEHGILRTILLMWRLRLAFYFGADPDYLARQYGYGPRDS